MTTEEGAVQQLEAAPEQPKEQTPAVEEKPKSFSDKVQAAVKKSLDEKKAAADLKPANLSANKTEDDSEATKIADSDDKDESVNADEDKKTDAKEAKDKEKPKSKKIPKRNESFTEEEQALFDEAPEEVQKLFKKRERALGNAANNLNAKLSEAQKQLEANKAYDKIHEEVKKATEEVNAIFRINGEKTQIDDKQYLKALVESDKQQRTNPLKFVQDFLKSNDIDLQQLAQGRPELAYNTEYNAVQQRLASIEAENQRLREAQQHKQHSEQQAKTQKMTQYINSKVEQLTSDIDAESLSTIEHFILPAFQQVKQQNPSITLDAALEQAVNISRRQLPDYYEKQYQSEQEAKRKAAEQRVAQAQGAAISPPPSNGAGRRNTLVGNTLQERIRNSAAANLKKFGN